MAKHTSKKFLAGILALSAGFVLASCDPVATAPKNYNDSIVSSTTGDKVVGDENILGTLYDSITGEKNAKIVSNILEDIAIKKFGTYTEFVQAQTNPSVLLEKDFFGNNEKRLAEYIQDINSRLSEYFYNEITSGSYNDSTGRFDEQKLINAHKYELYDLQDEGVTPKKYFVSNKLTKRNAFNSEWLNVAVYSNGAEGARGYIEKKVYPDILKNKLVEDYIYVNNPSSLGRAYARKVSYIKVAYDELPKAASEMLVEFADLYIKQDNHEDGKDRMEESTSRFHLIEKAIKGFSEFEYPIEKYRESAFNPDINIDDLLNPEHAADETKPRNYKTVLVDNIIKPYANIVDDTLDTYDEDAFNLNELSVKLNNNSASELVELDYNLADDDDLAAFKTHFTYDGIVLVKPGSYYKESKLGKILESYKKAIRAEEAGRFPTESDKAELDKFTSDGKPKAYGLMKKILDLSKENYVTDGWYVKNGGISDLPSSIRDRLFNIRVATQLDNEADLPVEDGTVGEKDSKSYLRNIYGKKLVLGSVASQFKDDAYNYINHDKDGKAFYICEVFEAPSTAKLSVDSKTVYKDGSGAADTARIESISRQVAKILGTKDSYIKDAYTDYLNHYDFTFYDSSLYEYLKSEYPDLNQFAE